MLSISTSVRLYPIWGGMGTQFKNEYFWADFLHLVLDLIVFFLFGWGIIASNTPLFDAEILP